MAYRRYARSSRGRVRSTNGRRSTRRRRVSRRRSGAAQRIVIQVVGGAGGTVPILGSTRGSKGVSVLRRRF